MVLNDHVDRASNVPGYNSMTPPLGASVMAFRRAGRTQLFYRYNAWTRGRPIEVLVASDLQRALTTAQALGQRARL